MTEEEMDTIRKKVDESWKDSVAKEKSKHRSPEPEPDPGPAAGEGGRENEAPPEANFEFFISSLGMQAMTALNEAHPEQSRYLIDTIQMLAEKTNGNLTPEESRGLQELLYQLQLQFVKKNQNP